VPVYPEDWFWPNLDDDQIAIRFSWSKYLPYFLDSQTVAYEWQQELHAQVAIAVAENLLPSERDIGHGVEIVQVGSAAQECYEVLFWLEGLPKEITTGLLVLGVEHSLAAFYGYVKHRVEQLRRTHRGKEVGVRIDVHSRALVELCKEHVVRSYGDSVVSQTLWALESRESLASDATVNHSDGVFQIVLRSLTAEYSYLVDRRADVIEHRINGADQPKPTLIPDVQDTSDKSLTRLLPSDTKWPSQDGVDRSGHIAILAGGRYDLNILDEATKPFLQKVVRESVAEVLPAQDIGSLEAKDHEIGPAAGAVEDWVVTLFENRESFAQAIGAIVDTWALYEIVTRIRRRLLSEEATQKNAGQPLRFFLPGGTLAMLCEDYVRRNYHPRAHLTSEWFCLTREFWFGYMSPGHPNAQIEYLILVSTSRETYRFKVWGNGEVTAHSVRRGRLDSDLPLPNLFEENESSANDQHA